MLADAVIKFEDEYEYTSLNEQICNLYREKFYPYYNMVWDSNDHFCKFGVGHFISRNSDLISVCTSPYVGGNYAEVDIMTIERYKRRGLATKLGILFINECLKRQLVPNWCCHSDNVESNNLAIKLGFEKFDEKPMYWYHV
jgi:RimJ/RimL family protein N-acetyltransferase